MLFDFQHFADITAAVFPQSPYSLEDALTVFHYYFQTYETYRGVPHPPIRASQIVAIIQNMPWLCQESKGGEYADIEPYQYEEMIDKHFATRYRRCDYNINHFFSGRIRELRLYECGY